MKISKYIPLICQTIDQSHCYLQYQRFFNLLTERQYGFHAHHFIESAAVYYKSVKFCFKSGDRKIINSVLESLIFNLFLIIHTRISEIHMFNFVNDSNGYLHLNEM